MGFFDSIKEGISNHFESKKKEREVMENLRKDAARQQQIVFEEQFRINAKVVAIAKAKNDALKLSGLQKLRASNRVRRLTEPKESVGTWFDKLSEYTQKNIANRETNLKRTEAMQKDAKEMREERMDKVKKEREGRLVKRKFGSPTTRKPFQSKW